MKKRYPVGPHAARSFLHDIQRLKPSFPGAWPHSDSCPCAVCSCLAALPEDLHKEAMDFLLHGTEMPGLLAPLPSAPPEPPPEPEPPIETCLPTAKSKNKSTFPLRPPQETPPEIQEAVKNFLKDYQPDPVLEPAPSEPKPPGPRPEAQLPDEPTDHYEVFLEYCQMKDRSIRDLAKLLKVHHGTLYRYKKDHHWDERLRAWNARQVQAANEAIQPILKEAALVRENAAKQMQEYLWGAIGMIMQKTIFTFTDPTKEFSPREAVTALDTVMKLSNNLISQGSNSHDDADASNFTRMFQEYYAKTKSADFSINATNATNQKNVSQGLS